MALTRGRETARVEWSDRDELDRLHLRNGDHRSYGRYPEADAPPFADRATDR